MSRPRVRPLGDPRPKDDEDIKTESRSRQILTAFLSGRLTKAQIANWSGVGIGGQPLTLGQVHDIVNRQIKYLWSAAEKWRQAETKCRALGIEMRLLRLGKEPAPDRPIESLNPPINFVKRFKDAGIETVNQLRAVDVETLLAYWHFPAEAIRWAILTLDHKKLSHSLAPRKVPKLRGEKVKPPAEPVKVKHTFRLITVGKRKFYATDDGRLVNRIRKRDR